ncbi:MAG: hypothetical protein ACFFB3_01780 [Candidatus Hodarchaeota archaeon]
MRDDAVPILESLVLGIVLSAGLLFSTHNPPQGITSLTGSLNCFFDVDIKFSAVIVNIHTTQFFFLEFEQDGHRNDT